MNYPKTYTATASVKDRLVSLRESVKETERAAAPKSEKAAPPKPKK